MADLLDIIKKFFTDNEWHFIELDEQLALQMATDGRNGKWNCYAQVDEDLYLFFFYSIFPTNVPEEKRDQVCEFITRANYGLKIGNFEMDYSDGEVRFKTSVDVENVELTPELISNQVYANMWTMDNYLPGIMSVIYGDISPDEAVEEVESE